MKEHLSLSQRIKNAASSQAVENVKAVHTYLHGRTDGTDEYDGIWADSEDISWAHAFGRMRGKDQVWHGNVVDYDGLAFNSWLKTVKLFPEIAGKDPRPIMEASVHTLVTDIIEVADDGKSARGSFLTPGAIHCTLHYSGKKYCHILWERYGSDFVLDDGEWKYLHEHVCPDILTNLDTGNWAQEDYARVSGRVHSEPPPVTSGIPACADPEPMHQPYTTLQMPQNTVPWPEPYKTMNNDNTYTPFIKQRK
jgi:hypothetical protein